MIYCLIGHSASGKSTLERDLQERLGVDRIISYTTRPPREGEVDGVDYNYINVETFNILNSQNFFQETAMYREWYYGLSLSGIDYKNKPYIAVVTIHGYKELVKAVGKEFVVGVYVKVDERTRMSRLLNRGDEVDEIIRRIQNDRVDFENIDEIVDYVIMNDENQHLAFNYMTFLIDKFDGHSFKKLVSAK